MANPIDVVVVGNALNSFGFVGLQYSVAGLGLNTFGFLWPCDAIWSSSLTPPMNDPYCGSSFTIWTSVSLAISNIETCTDFGFVD